MRFELGPKVPYEIPASLHRYTFDFELDNGIIIETKGIFDAQDRMKHVLIRNQWPNLDIRFVFSNPKTKIYPGSPTTYAVWCDRQGFKWSAKAIPPAWYAEKGPTIKPADAIRLGPPPEVPVKPNLGKGTSHVKTLRKEPAPGGAGGDRKPARSAAPSKRKSGGG